MPRWESTSLSVAPEKEQEAIETYQSFGWELRSSQEIFNKDSHQEARGDSIYSVTETTNYVKLVFQRDKDMPYYNEVCEIENKYFDLLNRKPIYYCGNAPIVIGALFLLPGAFFLYVGAQYSGTSSGAALLIMGLIIAALGLLIIVKRLRTKSRKKAEYNEQTKKWNNERSMLLAEVENYV